MLTEKQKEIYKALDVLYANNLNNILYLKTYDEIIELLKKVSYILNEDDVEINNHNSIVTFNVFLIKVFNNKINNKTKLIKQLKPIIGNLHTHYTKLINNQFPENYMNSIMIMCANNLSERRMGHFLEIKSDITISSSLIFQAQNKITEYDIINQNNLAQTINKKIIINVY